MTIDSTRELFPLVWFSDDKDVVQADSNVKDFRPRVEPTGQLSQEPEQPVDEVPKASSATRVAESSSGVSPTSPSESPEGDVDAVKDQTSPSPDGTMLTGSNLLLVGE